MYVDVRSVLVAILAVAFRAAALNRSSVGVLDLVRLSYNLVILFGTVQRVDLQTRLRQRERVRGLSSASAHCAPWECSSEGNEDQAV